MAQRAAVGTNALLAEAYILALDHHVSAEEADHIGPVLQQATCTPVNAQLIRRVGRYARIVDGLDRAVGDQDNEHVARAAEPIEASEQITPDSIGLDVSLAIAGCLDGGPIVLATDGCPNQWLERVDAIEHERVEAMIFIAKGGDGFPHSSEAVQQPEGRELEIAGAVFDLQEHRIRKAGGKGGLTDAFEAMDQDSRRQRRGCTVNVGDLHCALPRSAAMTTSAANSSLTTTSKGFRSARMTRKSRPSSQS